MRRRASRIASSSNEGSIASTELVKNGAGAVTLFALRHLMANGPVFNDGDAIPIPAGPVLTVRDVAAVVSVTGDR